MRQFVEERFGVCFRDRTCLSYLHRPGFVLKRSKKWLIEVEIVNGESADVLRPFLQRPQQEYGFEILVSDDQDSYKVLGDEMGVEHSICCAHVNRNVACLVAELAQQAYAVSSG